MKLNNTRRYAAMLCLVVVLNIQGYALPATQTGAAKAKTEVKAETQKSADAPVADTAKAAVADTTASSMLDDAALEMADTTAVDGMAEDGVYTQLKNKFVDGGVLFMSLIALTLIIGLACCIERIVYLSMSEIDAKNFMRQLETKLKTEGVDAAKALCRDTRGPVASICYQGLLRINDSLGEIERSVNSYASVQVGNMEKGSSWITLFIAMAPSLGFLGTVIGMVMSFDNIEMATLTKGMELFAENALHEQENNSDPTQAISMAKYFNAEQLQKVAAMAVRVMGGRAYFDFEPVSHYYREAPFSLFAGGTVEVQKMLIARSMGI